MFPKIPGKKSQDQEQNFSMFMPLSSNARWCLAWGWSGHYRIDSSIPDLSPLAPSHTVITSYNQNTIQLYSYMSPPVEILQKNMRIILVQNALKVVWFPKGGPSLGLDCGLRREGEQSSRSWVFPEQSLEKLPMYQSCIKASYCQKNCCDISKSHI